MANMHALPELEQYQAPDLLGNIAKLQGIQNAKQASEIQGQQLSQEKIQTANMQRDQADEQAVQQALASAPPGATLHDVLPVLAKTVSPRNFVKYQELDRKQRDDLRKQTTDELNISDAQHKQYGEIYTGVMQMPDDATVAQNWPQIAQSVNSVPGSKLQLDPNKPMTKDQLGQLAPMLTLKQSYIDAEMARRKEKATTEAAESDATLKAQQAKDAQQFGTVTNQQAENRYRTILQNLAAHKPVAGADLEFAHGYELANRKTTSTSDTLGISSTNTSGPSGLSAVPRAAGAPVVGGGAGKPAQNAKDSLVDLVGQYRVDPTTISRMFIKHPEMLGLVHEKYPDWDQSDYNAKNKLMVGLTSGPQSKELGAINTVMGHLKVLDEAVDALKNGDIKQLNRLGNALGIQVGNEAVPAFKTIVHRVGPEITTAYVQGGGGEAERIANAQDFNENLAPGVLHNNAAITVKLLRSKIGFLENQYKTTVHRQDFADRFLTQEAKASLARFSGEQQGGAAAANDSDPLHLR